MDFLDGDAEEEDTDRDFEDGGAGNIEELTDPPVLGGALVGLVEFWRGRESNPECQGGVFGGDIFHVLARAIGNAGENKCDVKRV